MRIISKITGELIAFVGMSSISYGLYMVYEPMAFIIGGALLVWFAVPSSKKT